MNFKIENNILEITNYPLVERHFEEMARKGWLISKILGESVFIYRKINPKDLNFSISPYQDQAFYTWKSKEELEEYKDVCESVGWKLSTKYKDFHIFYKEKDLEATELQTDEEEEFKTLEKIGRYKTRVLYYQIFTFAFLYLVNIRSPFINMTTFKSGAIQIVLMITLLIIASSLKRVVDIKAFLSKNRKNIELGKSIEYKDSNFYFEKFINITLPFLLFLFLLYMIYMSFLLKENLELIYMLPSFIGLGIGSLYVVLIKQSKKDILTKQVFLVVFVIAGLVISSTIGLRTIESVVNEKSNDDVSNYRALSAGDFSESKEDLIENLSKDFSPLVPQSYRISSYNDEEFVETEYFKVIDERLAQLMMKSYKKQAAKEVEKSFFVSIDDVFIYDAYNEYLEMSGFTQSDFERLKLKDKELAIKEAKEIVKEKHVIKVDKDIWNVDEGYFLNHAKMMLVIKKGKEIFFLQGKDFSNPEVVDIVKKKLYL